MIFHEIASVMIPDKITDNLVSLLKVSYKNKISISVESLYRFKENQKGRKRSNTRIHYKIPTKTFEGVRVQSAGNLRMNEVSKSRDFYFQKHIF